jgi:predicted lipoprotein with Yx(FWY)xxD motif
MKRSLFFVGSSAALTGALVACSAGYTASSPTPSSAPRAAMSAAPTPSPSKNGTTISTASTKVGQVLVDGSGRTVYLFEADKGKDSTCYDACAQAWPPVTTSGTPHGGTGEHSALLGTTTRRNGTTQVTYNGHPLYYFIGDRKPGDIVGQGLNQFGAKWYVLSPSGSKIDT